MDNRARSHQGSEANTLYEDTPPAKSGALPASYAKLYVTSLVLGAGGMLTGSDLPCPSHHDRSRRA